MAHVIVGDYEIEVKNEKKKVKAILRIVILLLVQHVNVCGLSGDAETRGMLCSCCESGAELQPRCIWFLLDTVHNSKFISVQDSTSYSVKLLLLVLFLFIHFFLFCFVRLWFVFFFFLCCVSGGILHLNHEEAGLCMCLNSVYQYIHRTQHFLVRKRCLNLSQEGQEPAESWGLDDPCLALPGC